MLQGLGASCDVEPVQFARSTLGGQVDHDGAIEVEAGGVGVLLGRVVVERRGVGVDRQLHGEAAGTEVDAAARLEVGDVEAAVDLDGHVEGAGDEVSIQHGDPFDQVAAERQALGRRAEGVESVGEHLGAVAERPGRVALDDLVERRAHVRPRHRSGGVHRLLADVVQGLLVLGGVRCGLGEEVGALGEAEGDLPHLPELQVVAVVQRLGDGRRPRVRLRLASAARNDQVAPEAVPLRLGADFDGVECRHAMLLLCRSRSARVSPPHMDSTETVEVSHSMA